MVLVYIHWPVTQRTARVSEIRPNAVIRSPVNFQNYSNILTINTLRTEDWMPY